ncbi:unnamed protein product [Auanema sp. JU1783]|nr:unnamed protein product [Auanema sp. JU1783]
MGCDLSTFAIEGGGSPQHLYSSKVSPLNELKKLASNHFHSVSHIPHSQESPFKTDNVHVKYGKECKQEEDVDIVSREKESDDENFEGDDYVLQAYRPQAVRPLTRASSIGSIMENRPPSEISNGSFTRVYRNRIASTNRYCIDTSRCKSNLPVVSLCSRKIGIQEFPNGRSDGRPCDLYWHNVVYGDMKSVVQSSSSRVNKFPGMTELAKKISLTHAISSMQKIFPKEYAFYPKSWFLPAHYVEFQSFYKKEAETRKRQNGKGAEMWFIVKPDEGAQGTGIYLINHPNQIKNPDEKQLVQEYVADPFLMGDSLKFDFRVYGVIRSINPLSMYVAREGMARFCTEKYEKPTSSNFENLFSHLTNYSLNKSNDQYVHSHSLEDQKKGSKRLLSTVFHQLEARGLKTKRLWHDIKLILIKTVLAMLPEIMLHYEHHFYDAKGPQCFQIMGFDIMIREDGTPVLLEVNAAPSLSIDHIVPAPGRTLEDGSQRVRSIVDEVIKIPLVKDTILLVLGLLDEEYSTQSDSHTLKNGKNVTEFQDDMSTLKTKRKPHLSEIFPTRYGAHSGHLLFLDKAMYIFMQFVQIRNTVNISAGGIRQFVRKCNLINVVTAQQIETKMAEINYFFSGDVGTLTNGLPFHAFLQFMFWIAEKKFPDEVDLLAKMQRLMAFCDSSLRHYGVRSARLRRIEVDTNQEENPVEIYMLPSRVRAKFRAKSTDPFAETRRAEQLRKDRNNNNNNVNNSNNTNGNFNSNNNSQDNNLLKLPKIKP